MRCRLTLVLLTYISCLGFSPSPSQRTLAHELRTVGMAGARTDTRISLNHSIELAQSPSSATTPLPLSTLRPGDQSPEVAQLQKTLTRLGYYNEAEDGIYGETTKTAVAKFQTAEGLEPDGVFGVDTWNRLQKFQNQTTPVPAATPSQSSSPQPSVVSTSPQPLPVRDHRSWELGGLLGLVIFGAVAGGWIYRRRRVGKTTKDETKQIVSLNPPQIPSFTTQFPASVPPQPSHQKPPKTLSLKAALTGVILLSVSATAAIVYIPWLMTSKRNVDSVVTQVNEEVMRGASQEVGRIFDNVLSTKHLIKRMFAEKLVDLNNQKERETFYLSLIEANPNFTWVLFGFENGDYFGVQRYKPGVFRLVNRKWDASKKIATKTTDIYQQTQQGVQQFVNREQFPENFYAPQRPWYRAAVATPERDAWTDVYVYATGKVPGLDSTLTLTKEGQFVGVLGIGFELKQISTYLQSMQVAKTGVVFIVNSKGELIASSGSENLTQSVIGQDQINLKRLSESSDHYLQLANRALQKNQLSLAQIKSQRELVYNDPNFGQKYYVSLKPTKYLDWTVGTVIPESVFLEQINRNQQILLVVVGSLIIVAATSAIFLSDRLIARPILAITQAAASIEAEKFELNSLESVTKRTDELGQLARVFQQMAREVYEREQRLKQQVIELQIEIDQTKRERQVAEITETDYFQELQKKAKKLRKKAEGSSE